MCTETSRNFCSEIFRNLGIPHKVSFFLKIPITARNFCKFKPELFIDEWKAPKNKTSFNKKEKYSNKTCKVSSQIQAKHRH